MITVILGNIIVTPSVFAAENTTEQPSSSEEVVQSLKEATSIPAVVENTQETTDSSIPTESSTENTQVSEATTESTRTQTTTESIKEDFTEESSTSVTTTTEDTQETTDDLRNTKANTPYTEAYINKYFKVTWANYKCYLSDFKVNNNGTLPDVDVVIPTAIKSDHWGDIDVYLGNSFFPNTRKNRAVKNHLRSIRVDEGPIVANKIPALLLDKESSFNDLFSDCKNLETVDLGYLGNPYEMRGFGVDNVSSVAAMFRNCPKLKSVRIDSY
ncbi:hypothetical protein G8B32_13470, partial [Enterococcus faecalis]|nr:hypothetical protein [Enterococcus faecalis]